ncbi:MULTISPECIES: DUF6879 family protein [Streptomyces]|uniref:DUF6879 domain-containing protein n=1 Tax=Streptomyces lonegramiae TaxID=3075524 RepID=A0ABU2XTY2_9ACTN|nr:DUF6879 family protein [Streptomyces sp. DSM 41529]MDT0548293.1 hypothetical protein [Streptomyces sp. DSM 41529]
MPDRNALELPLSQGERLSLEAYRSEYRQRRAELRDRHSWKFERQQEFEERDDSWEAFRRGHWEESLRLLGEEREALLKTAQRDRERGTAFHRVRVVEEPLTPYMQWELHALRVQSEAGKKIRVVTPAALGSLETTGPLPEVVVVGGQVLYQVVYTEAGVLDGAIRFTDTELTKRWERFIKELYEAGEDLLSYFERRVAHLSPPQPKAV